MFDRKIEARLRQQKKTGLYRNPPEINHRENKFLVVDDHRLLNFASNDYLGLGCSEAVSTAAAECFRKYGGSSSSSRLVTGNYSTIREAEKTYAHYFGYEDAMFFPSGYQANIALMSTLFDKGDVILFDKHIHASSVKGITLSGAAFYGFRHNSMSHLGKRLINETGNPVAVVTEGLFSMDGDSPDFKTLMNLKQEAGFLCIVDEAHSYGVMGEGGRGVSGGVADIGVGTFGKAFGLFGAFILMPEKYREYMVNFASPYIYTTSLPEAHAAATLEVLGIIRKMDDTRKYLADLSRYMKQTLRKEGFTVDGEAYILAIGVGNEEQANRLSGRLLDKGIVSFAARFPTVPIGKAILRVSLTAMHTENDVLRFVESLKSVWTSSAD